MPKITYCLLTLNRKQELQKAIRRVAPYVDRTIVIDGFNSSLTSMYSPKNDLNHFVIQIFEIDFNFK